MCAAHRSRKSRRRTVDGPVRPKAKTPYDGISMAALEYANAATEGSDEDFERAKWRWKDALKRYKAASKRRNGMPR